MSGHSKFNNIKHKKEKADAARGKIFTVIGHELAIAVKAGGPDPNSNSKLRDVIAKARANNMPNDTIEKGIKKAAGNIDAVNFEELTYEGFGPGGVAIMVRALTDNKNRTGGNVRSAFTKGSGNLGTQGSVAYMFKEKGQIIIDKEECEKSSDELMELVLENGASDFNEEADSYEVLTEPGDFSTCREAIEKAGIPMLEADITMIPENYVSVTDEDAVYGLRKTLDLLDEDEDVKAYYTNWEEE
ncbi:MAG: YebC/PmpR family DNA-binding transcriptional regulator [Lachnospiraceae bacterium]|nr:YebC/PmpR family DNA-binding transcriptional regulator [Lachnospiraceae bacterium]MBR1844823.1 YebC/PmpR family DNA-binding transcriptional regulator [Lachnospiraceae bacterium]